MRKARRDQDHVVMSRMQNAPKDSPAAILSASVIVLRDSPNGLETLMVERPKTATFAPGALVFPGGKVNPDDGVIDTFHARRAPLDVWQQQLQTTTATATRAVLFAAVRETFEETGVLLACDDTGAPVAQGRAHTGALARLRDLPDAGAAVWTDVLASERLMIDVDRLTLVSWWVTPHGYPKRFDTRFFVGALPNGATVTPQPQEIVSTVWISPATALREAREGHRHIIYPTRKNLAHIAPYATTAKALEALQPAALTVRRLCPQLVEVDGVIKVIHPDGGEPEDE